MCVFVFVFSSFRVVVDVVVVVVLWCVLCVCSKLLVGVFKIFGPLPRPLPPRRTALPWTAQNFALFFSLPPEISFFLLSLGEGGGSSRGIVAAVQGHGPPKMRVSFGIIL